MNVALGGYVIHRNTYVIDQYRDGTKIVDNSQVQLWTTVSGGTIGDGHGRYNSKSNPLIRDGQWQSGDQFCFDTGI